MNLDIEKYSEGIVIRNVKDFELKHIFDCGQCFRWKEEEDGSFLGVVQERAVGLIKKDNDVYIKGGNIEDKDLWREYLDLDRDYGEVKSELSQDCILKEAIKHGEGIRILNQEPFEIIISFIISANNRIPMIKRAVQNISREFGKRIEFDGREYYTFPKPFELSMASALDLRRCGCGFRAPYIVETTREIAEGRVNINEIRNMETDRAHNELVKLKGIGPKVADCILLFSMGKQDAFPVDVWVKRIMQYFYLAPDVSLKKIREDGRDRFGSLAGFAQQYLFYYGRDLKGKEGFEK